MKKEVRIIGGGLAGSESAYYLLKRGYKVVLFEMRPTKGDGAHVSPDFGELVCSNSLKSKRLDNACGLLKEEMRVFGSIMMEAALLNEVPAGNALSVDREGFSKTITEKLLSFPNFEVRREEVTSLPDDDVPTILASGPLTSSALLESLESLIGIKSLSFFDASAPIVKKESIDFSKAYYKSRFEQGDDAYINCPLSKEEYYRFIDALLAAEKAPIHSFDSHYFEGCMPVEVMASRGPETLRHGMMKPFGLGKTELDRPYAVVQLRQDTLLGDLYNIVGFQTNLTYPEQKRVFRLIPGLENAEFVRYGLMHRNVYIASPLALNDDFSLRNKPNVFVAGQLTGVEGYVESAASGILSAINLAMRLEEKGPYPLPKESVFGALMDYALHAKGATFAPMNANWSLLPNVSKEKRLSFKDDSLSRLASFKMKLDE